MVFVPLQDKHAQKHHFAAAGVPVAPFADIDSETALQAAAADFGFPLMLKSKRCAACSMDTKTVLFSGLAFWFAQMAGLGC